MSERSSTGVVFGVFGGFILLVCIIGLTMWGCPKYRVYRQELRGKAALREAEWEKKVLIEEASAKMESAQHYADAEITRAHGVAEANKIIGESLRENEAYLRYLWIQGLHDGTSEVIYIPTEANLPILEAVRKMELEILKQEEE